MAVRGAKARKIAPSEGISGSYDDIERKERDFEPYDGPEPKPGLYAGQLAKVGQHTTSDDAVVWIFTIDGGQYDGWPGWMYTNGSTTKWKQEQILVALGLMEEGGTINLTFEQIMKKAGPVRLRIQNEEYNDEMRPKISRVLKAASDVAPAADADEDEPDEDFDDNPKPTRAQQRKGKTPPEPEPEDDEDDDDAEEAREERAEELEELDAAALKKILKTDHGLKLADYKGKDEEALVEMILDLEFPAAEDDAEEDQDEDQDEELDLDELEEELGELSLADLKKRAKEDYGFALKDFRGKDAEGIIEMILTKLEGDTEAKEPPF